MDKPRPISPTDLYLELGTARGPVLIDVRTGPTFDADDRIIVSARLLPENPDQWKVELEKSQRFVVYGSQDDQTSRGVAEALCELGQEAAYLDGGFAAWLAQGFPTGRQLTTGARRWITRERPKIDRIACPWPPGRDHAPLIYAAACLRPTR